jgi:hypothetical protein
MKPQWLPKEAWKLIRKPNKSVEEWEELVGLGYADRVWDGSETHYRLNSLAMGAEPPQPHELGSRLF